MRVRGLMRLGVYRRAVPVAAVAGAAGAAGAVCPRCHSRAAHAPGRLRSCAAGAELHASSAVPASSAPRPRLVLGIETSCDDTGAAVVTSDGRVLGEAIAHQAEIHAAWGGVVPNLAMEAHREAIDRVVAQALSRAGVGAEQLDAVAVTIGPGLSLCLKVGITKARQIAREHQLPLVHVHHMEGHALVARLPPGATAAAPALDCTAGLAGGGGSQVEAAAPEAALASSSGTPHPLVAGSGVGGSIGSMDVAATVQFPFLCLLVSGGHNLLLLVQGVGQYMQLGTTLDDALGEAYDKVARMLGLELKPNGGAALEALARQGDPQAFKFAIPMRQHASCDFSYAGLKTSVRLAIEQTSKQHQLQQQQQQQQEGGGPDTGLKPDAHALPIQVKADVAASFQRVACIHLTDRVKRGITWAKEVVPELSDLVVAGGVASNQYVRAELSQLASSQGLTLVMPPPRWCTDNGVMIAWAGVERLRLGLAEPPPAQLAQRTDEPSDPVPEALDSGRGQDVAAVATSSGTADVAAGASASTDPAAAPMLTDDSSPTLLPLAGAGGSCSEPGAEEWIDIKPRWPLTTDYHPRREPSPWNARKARMHTSLTELTAAAAANAASLKG